METYKAGDRIEFIEDYFDYKRGDTATVKSAADWSATNQILDLGDNFSVLSYRVKPAAPEVGDKVRVMGGAWEGSEGVVETIGCTSTSVRMTAPSPKCWIRKGEIGRVSHSTSMVKIAELEPKPEAEPQSRVVNISEVKVGDLVRVTYADREDTSYGVKSSVRRVREGVVTRMKGEELISNGTLINAYFDGLSEAVYEVLPTPEPEKVLTWADKRPVGSVAVQMNGRRFLTKNGEDSWKITYPSSSSVTEKSNEGMALLFNEDDFLWTERS